MLLPSSLLKTQIDRICKTTRNNAFILDLELKNRTDEAFVVKTAIVDSLNVEQDFAGIGNSENGKVTDDITLNVIIPISDLVKIMKKQRDLYCNLIFKYTEARTLTVDLTQEPTKYEYNVYIVGLEDLAKKFNVNLIDGAPDENNAQNHQSNVLVPLTLQLISKEAYALKRKIFLGMCTDCDMETLIKYIAVTMGVKRINMVTPDNRVKYKNIYIPPEFCRFDVIFAYIQKRYGVYSKGLAFYFTNNVLYVYPKYDTAIIRKDYANFIRPSVGSYIGLTNYHDYIDGVLNIVSVGNMESKSLHSIATENEGNARMFLRADKIIDGTVEFNGDTPQLTKIAAVVGTNDDLSIVDGASIPKFAHPTMNVYEQMSKLQRGNAEIAMMSWGNARLFTFIPGHKIELTYDNSGFVENEKGILQGITYTCRKSKPTGNVQVFDMNALVVLRIDPATKKRST